MKKLVLVTLLTMGLASTGQAAYQTEHGITGDMRPVDRVQIFNRLDGWEPLDRDSLIIWATPFKPYLVELSRPSFDLRYVETIGVTSMAGSVYTKFDNVVVHGIRYPIRAIYEIDRTTARHLEKAA